MNLRLFCAALALIALLSGCAKPAAVYTPPAGDPPVQEQPAPGAVTLTHSIGAYREALGPGLVVQGHTSLPQARAELRVAGQTVQSETVSAKDGGPGTWGLVWPAPAALDAEVVLINPADGQILARGPVSPDLFVGLFHSQTFADTRVDAKATDRSRLRVAGKVTAGDSVRVEFRDLSGKLLGMQTVKAEQGAFDAELTRPDESHVLYFYTAAGQLGLMIQIVER